MSNASSGGNIVTATIYPYFKYRYWEIMNGHLDPFLNLDGTPMTREQTMINFEEIKKVLGYPYDSNGPREYDTNGNLVKKVEPTD